MACLTSPFMHNISYFDSSPFTLVVSSRNFIEKGSKNVNIKTSKGGRVCKKYLNSIRNPQRMFCTLFLGIDITELNALGLYEFPFVSNIISAEGRCGHLLGKWRVWDAGRTPYFPYHPGKQQNKLSSKNNIQFYCLFHFSVLKTRKHS